MAKQKGNHGARKERNGFRGQVLAPANVACAEYEAIYGPLTKDICAYHVIKGVVSTDGLSGAPLNTLQGGTITYRRMFRRRPRPTLLSRDGRPRSHSDTSTAADPFRRPDGV